MNFNNNFIILGERRCGTTSLYDWLSAHPGIFMPPNKDINYFIEEEIVSSRTWLEGKADADRWEREHNHEEYAKFFPYDKSKKVSGHKGADLLFWQPAHKRIKNYLPNAKFIVILRNPIIRAWSHYWNEFGKGRETLSFLEALEAETERCESSDYAKNHLSYELRGHYVDSLKKFEEVIPKEQLKVIILEKMNSNPEKYIGEIYSFLGLDSKEIYKLDKKKSNSNWTMIKRKWAYWPLITQIEKLYCRLTEKIVVSFYKDTEKRRKMRLNMNFLFYYPAKQVEIPKKIYAKLKENYKESKIELENYLGISLNEWWD